MLILEYKLRTNQAQHTSIDEAIRTVQFVRNKCLRKWMDGRGIGDNERPRLLCPACSGVPVCCPPELRGPSDQCRSGLAFDRPLL